MNLINLIPGGNKKNISKMLCIAALSTSSLFAFAQHQQVSLTGSNISLRSVFQQIEKQTKLSVDYKSKDLNDKRIIKTVPKSGTVKQTLEQLLNGTNCEFSFTNGHILIKKSTNKLNQQQKQIIGVVVDSFGEPVAGANIVEKGTNNGTVTDMNGKFSIDIHTGATIVVSYIGFKNFEETITNQKSLIITIQEDSEALDEIVVVGYGTQKKANLSGAVESISSKSLQNRATNNLGVALQGIAPGLDVYAGSGQADWVPSFNIRGETSINGGGPLIIVDGIPTSAADFSRMNAADIENLSILKDASSAAIYGARAAFGVIMVTTKKGEGEKLTVHFNNTFNARTMTRMPKIVMDPYIQTTYKNEMGKPWYDQYTSEEVEYTKKMREDPSLPKTILSTLDPNKYTYLACHDWFDDLFDKVGISHQHSLSVSGASKKVSYYLSADYYGESGLLHYNKDQYNRFNIRNKVEFKPVSWLTIGNNTSLIYYTYDCPTNFNHWLFNKVYKINSLVPTYNPDGSYTEEGANIIGTLLDGGEKEYKEHVVNSLFTAEVDLVKDVLAVKADFTAKMTDGDNKKWDSSRNFPYRTGPLPIDYDLNWGNYVDRNNSKTVYTLVNLYADFHKDFGRHNLSAVGGFSQEYESYRENYAQRKEMITDTYPTPQLSTGEMSVTEYEYQWALRSGFYRLNYIYDNKYILETNGRYDGSSRFPHDNRFGFLPSVSAAWILSQEKFFKPLTNWFSHAKLRMSYGALGNQDVSYYPYIASMSSGKMNVLLNGEKPMGVWAPNLVSNALTWEKVYTINGGIDVNFFNNRLSVSADVYRRDTKDMLTKGKTLPEVLGTAEPQINAADMKTRGWEMKIQWQDQFELANSPFKYSAKFILSDSRAFITRFDNPTNYLSDYYEGMEIGEIWGLETEGFFKDQEDIDNHADQWTVTAYPGDRPIEPGDLKYKDLDGNGKIDYGSWTLEDHGDYKKIGNTRNRFNFGLDLNAEWKGFDFRALFQGVGKKDWYPSGFKFFGIYYSPWGNVLENNMDHWTPDNPNAYFPRLKSYLAYGVGDLSNAQTRYLQNAAYARLKNLTFGYSLPKSLINKIKIENLRIYFSGENLFEITSLCKNFDPEALNQDTHPFQRTYSIGLNITL